jgi:hypothetical protein
MKKFIIFMFSIVLLGSCQKDINGCTDPTALNYSNLATEDDGSCMYESVFVETFNLTFDASTSMGFYTPMFNYESGDVIIIETVNQYLEWTALPLIIDIDVHVQGAYDDGSGTVWIYLRNDDGIAFFPSTSLEQTFRVALIKSNALKINPDLKGMTIDEINSTI